MSLATHTREFRPRDFGRRDYTRIVAYYFLRHCREHQNLLIGIDLVPGPAAWVQDANVSALQDTSLLGFTTKHIYFSGPKKRFRVRYDKIADFEPYDDGFGIMRDDQIAKPRSFRTGRGCFAYNLALNLVQM